MPPVVVDLPARYLSDLALQPQNQIHANFVVSYITVTTLTSDHARGAMTPPFQDLPSHRGLLGIAPDQLDRFTATKSVQFLVGHDRAEFSIHPNLLSSLSAPLIALVNGETEESSERCVTCEDVDKAVFSRFVQFVYTGAYTGFASAEKDGPARHSEVIEITANVDGQLPDTSSKDVPFSLSSANTTTRQGNAKDSSDSTALFGALRGEDRNGLFKLPYSLASYHRAATEGIRSLFGGSALPVLCKQHQPGSRRSSKRIFATTACDCGPYQMKRDFVSAFVEKYGGDDGQIIRQTKPTSEAMSFVFLGHARVWVFAHRFAIASLMDLAFSQLAHELTQWTIWPSAFVPAFGGLVCYVYGNRSAGDCQLRHLVAQFAACVAKDVSGLEGWSALLKEVPDFAADLVEQMTNRLA